MREYIPVYAADFGDEERIAIQKHIAKDALITAGKEVDKFEREFAAYHGRQYGVMTNSGSSALLIAIASMGWKPGDRVITPAVTFPTTISPLLHFGIQPVFVDVELGTYNIDLRKMIDTIIATEGIKGAVIPHTLGNPVNPSVWSFFDRSIEDACDAFGSAINDRLCGTFGDVSTFSFYPAHHLTTGEGGMATTANYKTHRKLFQFANWGRDCWCRPGYDDTCKNRFGHEINGIPIDHKYLFTSAGFNVKPLELCGVLGRVQLKKAGAYHAIRRRNFDVVRQYLAELDDYLVLPKSLPGSEPSWFSFPVTLKRGDRRDICMRIEARGVATRLVMAGNVARHPMMGDTGIVAPCGLEESDNVMRNAFCVGVNQTVTEEESHHIGQVVKEEVARG